MRIGFGINQLGSDADPGSRPLDLPFEHIAHAKLAADLLRVDRLVSVSESGIARDHEHVRDPRQIGCQISGDPVGEILLFGVVAQIGKGQHGDRRTRRWGGLRGSHCNPRCRRFGGDRFRLGGVAIGREGS